METEPLAWIGESESNEIEDAMVARYRELRGRKAPRRRILGYALGALLWVLAALGALLLFWAIGQVWPE